MKDLDFGRINMRLFHASPLQQLAHCVSMSPGTG